MKRKTLLILGVCLVAFSSCKKDDDKNVPQFMSGKKIEEIYRQSGSSSRYLQQQWNWKDNGQLKSIDHYYSDGDISWTETFTFNDDNLVTEVNDYSYNEKIEYKYEGTRLIEARFYSDNALRYKYDLDYKDGKLKKIEQTSYDKSDDETHLRAFSNILPNHVTEALAETKIMNNAASKGTTIYNFTWEGSNIKQMEVSGDNQEYRYEYDDKKNPFCEFCGLDFNYNNFSANNCTLIRHGAITTEYRYDYDGNYPTERLDKEQNVMYYYKYVD